MVVVVVSARWSTGVPRAYATGRAPANPTCALVRWPMADGDDASWKLEPPAAPPAAVSAALFAAWREARRGAGNPEDQTNPVWVWLARNPELTAYRALRHFGPHQPDEPTWCNQRHGQSTTTLPDGRTLRIGGEHEDYYDPDFYIYNDVQVTSPAGVLTILGYREADFPPTDFHSASLVGDDVYVVGNLGYASQRRHDRTQVYRLDTRTMAFAAVDAAGDTPGWLHGHRATVVGRTLTVRGGQREVRLGDRTRLRDNGDDYTLELDRRVWTRDTDRRWRQWEVDRTDGQRGRLWEVDSLASYRDRADPDEPRTREGLADALARLGFEPDLAAWAERFTPPIAHTALPQDLTDDGGWRTHRVVVDGVTVRYVQGDPTRVVIEGELPTAVVASLVDDLAAKLSRVEHTTYAAVSLDA